MNSEEADTGDVGGRYGERPRRRGFPMGATGVGLLCAGLAALVALAIPLRLLESAAWEFYLDELISAARPPFGTTARLLFVAGLASLTGAIGWAIATWFRVMPDNRIIDGLRARFGRDVDADEDDAPLLNPADRHPDAPARRPFSAARDMRIAARAAQQEVADDVGVADGNADEFAGFDAEHLAPIRPAPPAAMPAPPAAVGVSAEHDVGDDDDAEDELLLDASLDPALAPKASDADVRDDTSDDTSHDTVQPFEHDDATTVQDDAEQADDAMADDDASEPLILADDAVAADAVETLDHDADGAIETDTQGETVSEAGIAADSVVDAAPVAALTAADAAPPVVAAVPPATPAPLDLSLARLDDLIARLEAGLTRRAAVMAEMESTLASTPSSVAAPASAPSARAVMPATVPAGTLAPVAAPVVDAATGPVAAPVAQSLQNAADVSFDDPNFPQDPALAAALATLRRMNQAAG